jgi:hypothetical protein
MSRSGLPHIPELHTLADSVGLTFPIASKQDFVVQMTKASSRIRFNGLDYDSQFAANLIPAFFFPLENLDDLLTKSTELLLSRGFVPDHDIGAQSE